MVGVECGSNCFVEQEDVKESPLDLVDAEFIVPTALPGDRQLLLGVPGKDDPALRTVLLYL